MRGKLGLVIGLTAGYVLGTRAGRERYEQIKTQAEKVWELDAVQNQVDKAKDLTRSAVLALPVALWRGGVRVTKAVTERGSTVGEKIDAGVDAAEKEEGNVKRAANRTKKAVSDSNSSSSSSGTASKSSGSKSSGSKSSSSGSKSSSSGSKSSTAKKSGGSTTKKD